MFRTKSLLVFAVVMMVALTSSVMALDTITLRQNMWMWSQCEAVLNESLHFNFGHTYTPVISPEECYNEIEKARSIICKIVSDITSEKDMREARAVADEFKNMHGHEEEVGKTLQKLLDMQEKYIKAHRIY